MTVLTSGFYTIILWVVATITDIVIGGWLVDVLIKREKNPTRVRKTLFTIGLLLGIAVIGAAFTINANVAIFWISIALSGLAFAAPIGWSIPELIAPKGAVGTVGSIMNLRAKEAVSELWKTPAGKGCVAKFEEKGSGNEALYALLVQRLQTSRR